MQADLSGRPNFALKDAEPLKQYQASLSPNDIDRNLRLGSNGLF
jgi:hypothetical protein